jgi:Domain of unknown function (DUF4390)
MLRAATERLLPRSRNRWGWLLALALLAAAPAPAADAELTSFEIEQGEDGLLLGYAVNFELSPPVEEALAKAVPLHFVAEAELFRERWYWRDKRVARATRVWRIVYQPLTSLWRVTFGDLGQTYPSRAEALAAVRRAVAWKIAEPGQIEDGERHYVEFSFRLDTTQLPRPMQIGIGGQPEWTLVVERVQRLP